MKASTFNLFPKTPEKEDNSSKNPFTSIKLSDEPDIDNLYDDNVYAKAISSLLNNWKKEVDYHIESIDKFKTPIKTTQDKFVLTMNTINNISSAINLIEPEAKSALDKLTLVTNEQEHIIEELNELSNAIKSYSHTESKTKKEKNIIEDSNILSKYLSTINEKIQDLECISSKEESMKEINSKDVLKSELISMNEEINEVKKGEIELIQEIYKKQVQ